MVDSACARFVTGNSPKHDNITAAKKIAFNFTKTLHDPSSRLDLNFHLEAEHSLAFANEGLIETKFNG